MMIKKIYKKGQTKKAIKILDRIVKDFWKLYINEDPNNNDKGFYNINNNIKQFKEKEETEDYIIMYKYVQQRILKKFLIILKKEKE